MTRWEQIMLTATCLTILGVTLMFSSCCVLVEREVTKRQWIAGTNVLATTRLTKDQ